MRHRIRPGTQPGQSPVPPRAPGKGMHLSDLIGRDLAGMPIEVRNHCYGCTAGQGSSCGGSLSPVSTVSGLDALAVVAL